MTYNLLTFVPLIISHLLFVTYLCSFLINHLDFNYSMSGGELFDRIAADDYKMSEAEVIKYISQVCDGIKYMHDNNYVHLDVKASLHSFHSLLDSFYFNIKAKLSKFN